MTLALVIGSWRIEPWLTALEKASPGLDVRVHPDRLGDVADITHVMAWRSPRGSLQQFPNLKAMFSLGAGVDHLLADPTLPDVPLVRVVDPDLTSRMSEYVCLHVLMHHRQQRLYDGFQARREWRQLDQWAAGSVRVGIMGFGVMGQDAARTLMALGFRVNGWSRTPKRMEGVACYAGADGLDAFLGETDILVCLLPATADTAGILDRKLIGKLARTGPLGGPVLINAGRGRLQVAGDIVAALDAGELQAATLDVFETEPLPADSPLWSHPKVTVTPHVAADSDPDSICRYVVGQIERQRRGEELQNVVDRTRGY